VDLWPKKWVLDMENGVLDFGQVRSAAIAYHGCYIAPYIESRKIDSLLYCVP